jgi:hypothetical protein
MRIAILLSALAVTADTAHAATITRQDPKDFAGIYITIEGHIEEHDGDKFTKVLASVPGGRSIVINLNSPGGSIVAALTIGEIVHRRGFSTLVSDYTTCASACSYIWLAGRSRWATGTSLIGFHGPGEASQYRASQCYPDDVVQTMLGFEAFVGSYLFEWGVSHEAILFVTVTPLNKLRMSFLTREKAEELHIAHIGALPVEQDLQTLLMTMEPRGKSDREPITRNRIRTEP